MRDRPFTRNFGNDDGEQDGLEQFFNVWFPRLFLAIFGIVILYVIAQLAIVVWLALNADNILEIVQQFVSVACLGAVA